MDIEKALNILGESHIILERKRVSEMTPEEYEKDLAARRKRREQRKQRAENATSTEQHEKPKSDEELRRKNAEQIAKGYEDAEREIKKDLSNIRNNFKFYCDLYDGDKTKFARTALKSLTSIKDKLESGNMLSDVRTSIDASRLLDDIQRKITEIRAFIRGNRKSIYMDPFRYLEVTFKEITANGYSYKATPTNSGRPMDEWGKPLRIYAWDLPDKFDARNTKVSKAEFTKWVKRLKLKFKEKYVAGTSRNRITWDTYNVYASSFELIGPDWEYGDTISFEGDLKTSKLFVTSVKTNTGETLL